MSLVKIGPKHQITIPKNVRSALHLEAGDLLEIVIKEGKGMLVPKTMATKAPTLKLTTGEQKLLEAARKKIQLINEDHVNSKGLTRKEADVAAKVGIIDPEQKYWWLEDWQKGEREAQQDIAAGRVSETFTDAQSAINHLRSL